MNIQMKSIVLHWILNNVFLFNVIVNSQIINIYTFQHWFPQKILIKRPSKRQFVFIERLMWSRYTHHLHLLVKTNLVEI